MLDVLGGMKASPVAWAFFYGGLGSRNKLIAILIKKINFFQLYFCQFLGIKTLDTDPDSLEMLGAYPDPDSMNLDPQHWSMVASANTIV